MFATVKIWFFFVRGYQQITSKHMHISQNMHMGIAKSNLKFNLKYLIPILFSSAPIPYLSIPIWDSFFIPNPKCECLDLLKK